MVGRGGTFTEGHGSREECSAGRVSPTQEESGGGTEPHAQKV